MPTGGLLWNSNGKHKPRPQAVNQEARLVKGKKNLVMGIERELTVSQPPQGGDVDKKLTKPRGGRPSERLSWPIPLLPEGAARSGAETKWSSHQRQMSNAIQAAILFRSLSP